MHGLAFGLFSFFSLLLFLSFLPFLDFLSLDFLALGEGLLLRGAGVAVSPCLNGHLSPLLQLPFAKNLHGFSDFLPLLELLGEFLELLREDGLDELLDRLDLKDERPLELALRERDDSRLRGRGRALESCEYLHLLPYLHLPVLANS